MRKLSYFCLVLLALVLPAGAATNVFLDDFDSGIGSAWDSSGASASGGRMRIGNGGTIYTNSTFARVPGRAVVHTHRGFVVRGEGPWYHLATAKRPANPGTAGYGWYAGQQTGSETLYRNYLTPIANSSRAQFYESEDNVDTFLITVMRQQGVYLLLAGGRMSQAPQARLCFIGHSGTEGNFYFGGGNTNSNNLCEIVRVDDLGGDWASEFGITKIYDSFNRAGGSDPGSPEKGALGAWQGLSGSWTINANQLRVLGSGLVLTEAGQADGLWETKITLGSGGAGGLVFRAVDSNNYWYYGGDNGKIVLVKKVGGVSTTVYQSSAYTLAAGNAYNLVVRAEGDRIWIWHTDGSATGSKNPIHDTALMTATKAGLVSTAGVIADFDNFAVYPLFVTMPSEIFKQLVIPNGQGGNLVYDSFTDSEGKNLTQHTHELGPNWVQQGGNSFTITNNAVKANGLGAYASILIPNFTGALEAESNILMPPTQAVWPLDWFPGLFVGTYQGRPWTGVQARFLWQGGNGEIEMWEYHDGGTYFNESGLGMNAVNIGGRLQTNTVYNLRVAHFGNEAIAYWDGVPVLQMTTKYPANSNQAGLTIDGSGDTASRWNDFRVRRAYGTLIQDTQPPSVPANLRAIGRSGNSLTLLWAPASDNLGVFDYQVYRNGGLAGTVSACRFIDTALSPGTLYTYTVKARDELQNASALSAPVQGQAGTILPSAWRLGDVGATGAAGSGGFDPGQIAYTISGSGANINANSDEFCFLYQTLRGDGAITTRVLDLENPSNYAKAGVMIRQGLGADAAHAAMFVMPATDYGAGFYRRLTTAGTTVADCGPVANPPQWVRLKRAGDIFTGFLSSDGINWTQVGTAPIAMTGDIEIGLIVSSRVHGTLAAGIFEQVTIKGSSDLDNNGSIDLADLDIMAAHWMQSDTDIPGDIDLNGMVDVWDFARLSANWIDN